MKQSYLLSLTLAAGLSFAAAGETYVAPCTLAIDSEATFEQWTSIDANKDGGDYLWKYSASKEGAYYVQNTKGAADDWLISPAVTLKPNTTYNVSLWIQNCTSFSSDKQKVALYAGTAPEIAAQATLILKDESVAKASWPVEKKGTFTTTEGGDYYLGTHLYSASYQGDCLITKIVIEERLTFPNAVTGLSITGAPEGELAAELSWTWPSTNDAGGELQALSGAYIYRNTSSFSTATESYLVGTLEENATPGTPGTWTDSTVPSAGKYYYMVVPFDTNGASTAKITSTQSSWIGPDKPGNVSKVVASAVPDNDKAISLTFDLPVGQNGGYLDLSKVSYKINRTEGSNTAVTIEDSWQGELPYIDSTLPGLGSYVYEVYTVYEGSSSWSGVKSNAVVSGGTLSLPYTNTFDNSSSISLWTLLNEGNGTRNWNISSSKLDYWGSGTAIDVYAVTPAFDLEAGHAYKITFDTYVSKASDTKNLSLLMGEAPSADALTTTLYEETISSQYSTTKSVITGVSESGIYNFAFRVNGNISGSNDIYIDNLKIEEIVEAPAKIETLSATPAADGELSVDLTWTNPSLTNAGSPMAIITKIEIMRGSDLVATLDNLEGGSETTYKDETVPSPGIYTYTLTPYLNTEAGESTTVTTTWVGMDTPKAPANVAVTMDEAGNRVVTFDAVTEGVNGGYIDTEALRYVVARNGETLAEVTESPYTDETADLPLASYVYSVAAKCGDLESAAVSAPGLVFGAALELPYYPDFSTAAFAELWTFVNPSNVTQNWKYNTSKQALSSDYAGSWAITPPFKALPLESTVTFKATCWSARYTEDLEIYLISDLSDLDNAVKIGDYHVESVSYPSPVTMQFKVPSEGVYHIGYKLVSGNWTCYLYQSDVVIIGYETGVDAVTSATFGYDAANQTLTTDSDGNIAVYNVTGQLVMESEASESVSVKTLSAGIYVAILTAADGSHKELKFVKKH